MWLNILWQSFRSPRRGGRLLSRRRPALRLELLEDRTLPASFTAASVADLIADINAANLAGGSNTITLSSARSFRLTAVDNTVQGATGLPVIAANNSLTIHGAGRVIEREVSQETPAFRLFAVASGASLTLEDVTLQGGMALGLGFVAQGGAVRSEGALTMHDVRVQNNVAQGSVGLTGQFAAGGAIYSTGSLLLKDCTIGNNQALGGRGRNAIGGGPGRGRFVPAAPGGDAFGGAVCVAGGRAVLIDTQLASNLAQGGEGGHGGGRFSTRGANGGDAAGGALCVRGGNVQLSGATVSNNTAQHGGGGQPRGHAGLDAGGGLAIDADAFLALDGATKKLVKDNHAGTDSNIAGRYVVRR